MPEPPAAPLGGLTVADEVLLLHCSLSAWGSIELTVAAAVFADLALAGRIGIREADLRWWQRASSLNRRTDGFRVVVDDPTPLADPVLDSALSQVAAHQPAAGPMWCIQHVSPWKEILTRLVKGGILIPDRDSSHSAAEKANNMTLRPGAHQDLRQLLRGAVLDPGEPDDRAAAVLLLARSGGLLSSSTKVGEFLGPVDRAVMRHRLKVLASLPSLAPVRVLAEAITELRQRRSANDVAVWQLSS